MDFVQKSKFFLAVFFTEILSENNVFDVFWKKKNDFKLKNLMF